MSLLSKLFNRSDRTPRPALDALLEAREVPLDIPGLDHLRPDFDHLAATDRERFADAVAELHRQQLPLPPPWLDAQYDLSLEVIPSWRGEREALFHRPFAEGLSERVLVGGHPMPEAWPVLWLVSLEEILERATDQLREASKGHPFEKLPSGIYRSRFEDGRDAARVLLPELWENLFPGQNHFIAVPAPDCLLVAPQVLLPKLLEAIQKQIDSRRVRIMATIFQWVNHSLLPANLQDPHPIAQPQRELRQLDYMVAVSAQDEDLDPSLGRVMPLASLRAQNGRSFVMATWQDGAPALLPETDLIGFHTASGEPLGIFWRHTLPRIPEVRGELLETWGPRRLRYETFPTPTQLAKLECFATAEQMKGILAQAAEKGRPAPQQGRGPAPGPQAGATPQSAAPLPPHLRGAGLGMQDSD